MRRCAETKRVWRETFARLQNSKPTNYCRGERSLNWDTEYPAHASTVIHRDGSGVTTGLYPSYFGPGRTERVNRTISVWLAAVAKPRTFHCVKPLRSFSRQTHWQNRRYRVHNIEEGSTVQTFLLALGALSCITTGRVGVYNIVIPSCAINYQHEKYNHVDV